MPIYSHRGKLYIEAQKGIEYKILLTNNSSHRLAVALSVDVLNTIDATHTSASYTPKWVIYPHETITINGWQVSITRSRSFFFTTEENSYGGYLVKKQNLGIISAVVYNEKKDSPSIITSQIPSPALKDEYRNSSAALCEPLLHEQKKSLYDYAATGMGRSLKNRVKRIKMNLDDYPCQIINYR